MIDVDNLKVGDIMFYVKEENTNFNRKKIHIDIDGMDYFRYDKPLRKYHIVKCLIEGILEKTLHGHWPDIDDYDLETDYCVKFDDKIVTHIDDFWFEEKNEVLFYNYDDAYDCQKEKEEEARLMDIRYG